MFVVLADAAKDDDVAMSFVYYRSTDHSDLVLLYEQILDRRDRPSSARLAHCFHDNWAQTERYHRRNERRRAAGERMALAVGWLHRRGLRCDHRRCLAAEQPRQRTDRRRTAGGHRGLDADSRAQVRRSGELNWQTIALVAVALVLFVLALLSSRVAIAAVPAIYPMVFSALRLRTAIVVSTVLDVHPLAFLLMIDFPRESDIAVAVVIILIGVSAAPVIGIMVVTASRQWMQLVAVVTELAATQSESARLSREACEAMEWDRLTREVYDTLTQGLTSIVVLAQAVESELATDPLAVTRHVEPIRGTARKDLAEARVMVTELNLAALDDGSLPAAIHCPCDNLSAETGFAVTMRADETPPVGHGPRRGAAACRPGGVCQHPQVHTGQRSDD